MPQSNRPFTHFEVKLRPCELSDAASLLAWRNHDSARLNSRTTKVITLEEHLEWLNYKLGSDASRCKIFMFLYRNAEIGVSRLDFETTDIAEVSINVNPSFQGNGFGKIILQKTIEEAKKVDVSVLKAVIKISNLKSNKLFEYFGFSEVKTEREFGYFQLNC